MDHLNHILEKTQSEINERMKMKRKPPAVGENRMFVANIPPGISGNLLARFLNNKMRMACLTKEGGNAILNCQINPNKKGARLQLRSEQETMNLLTLNNIKYRGRNLKLETPEGRTIRLNHNEGQASSQHILTIPGPPNHPPPLLSGLPNHPAPDYTSTTPRYDQSLPIPPPTLLNKLAESRSAVILEKLSTCHVKNNKDAILAMDVMESLIKALKSYGDRHNEVKASELLMDAELKVSTIRALDTDGFDN